MNMTLRLHCPHSLHLRSALILDTLSSDGSADPGDVSAHPICISDVSIQSGDLDQVLFGDNLPSSVHVDLDPKLFVCGSTCYAMFTPASDWAATVVSERERKI